jgi:hypothetical protein
MLWCGKKKEVLLICAMATGLTVGPNRGKFNGINISLIFYSKVSSHLTLNLRLGCKKGFIDMCCGN